MRSQRNFSLEFKPQVVEELISGESGAAQLCRRYNISSSLLDHWKKQYSRVSSIMSLPRKERLLFIIELLLHNYMRYDIIPLLSKDDNTPRFR